MASSAFRRGALSILVVQGLVIVAMVSVWMITSRDEPPDPTATRRQAEGTVTQTGRQLCVEGRSDSAGEAVPRLWCGLTDGGLTSGVAVGDAVVGSIIEVELDPGSGPAWSFWESLSSSAEGTRAGSQ